MASTCIPTAGYSYNDDNELALPDSVDCPLPRYVWLKGECYETWDNQTQLFDIVLPKNSGKTPVVIFIHGGSFFLNNRNKGFKASLKPLIAKLLCHGISYVTLDYRLLLPPATETFGIKKCLFDCVAALQWIRANAAAYNLTKSKIAFIGESAGAGTSLWIALSKSMKSSNPLASIQRKQSTKVKAVVALETQGTYNMNFWPTNIFSNFPAINLEKIRDLITKPKLKSYYLATNLSNEPAIEGSINTYLSTQTDYLGNPGLNLDMIGLMKKTSCPIWLDSNGQPATEPTNSAHLNHHPNHAKALLDQADSLAGGSLVAYALLPKLLVDNRAAKGHPDWEMADFLIHYL